MDDDASVEQPVDKIEKRDVAVAKGARDVALLALPRCLSAPLPRLALTLASTILLGAVPSHRADSIELLTKL